MGAIMGVTFYWPQLLRESASRIQGEGDDDCLQKARPSGLVAAKQSAAGAADMSQRTREL
jgi:hypothetical protein